MTYEEAIAKRCVQWMNDVIDVTNDLCEPNEEMEQDDINTIENARYIIECIEKQIPNKVKWTLDYIWGIKKEVPVCPTCDYYLAPIGFIEENTYAQTGRYESLKVSYCDHCSQAIDWSDNE